MVPDADGYGDALDVIAQREAPEGRVRHDADCTDTADDLRVTVRTFDGPSYSDTGMGFRLVRSIP